MQNPQDIVKALTFGSDAKEKVFAGIEKLTNAVSSTLGASGKCVILEDFMGRPMITKDGVTVANSVNLREPVENIGATLIKEAARKTVGEAGDGTTTATVLAHAILSEAYKNKGSDSLRSIKQDIQEACNKTVEYLENISVPVEGDMVDQVATISSNNDESLGKVIGEAFKQVGKNGTVMMDPDTKSEDTTVELVSGSQINQGFANANFVRKIQTVLEYAVKQNRSILIIGELEKQPMAALVMNKIKGNIKASVIAPPGFSFWKKDFLDDIAAVTGATHISEEYGDDVDLITPDMLGECERCVSDNKSTVLKVAEIPEEAKERIKVIEDQIKTLDPSLRTQKLEERLAILSGNVAVISIGANSDVEFKEKKDRVDDAIHATKAAVKEGIVPGGGIALLNAANNIKEKTEGTNIFTEAIKYPYKTILKNAGLEYVPQKGKGKGINVITGETVNMINEGIIDPLLVTKSALKNAVSVATTILSTDCVISNMREE
jgi:chaperonin GroEL